jgi:hypothetical protein
MERCSFLHVEEMKLGLALDDGQSDETSLRPRKHAAVVGVVLQEVCTSFVLRSTMASMPHAACVLWRVGTGGHALEIAPLDVPGSTAIVEQRTRFPRRRRLRSSVDARAWSRLLGAAAPVRARLQDVVDVACVHGLEAELDLQALELLLERE